MSLRLWFIAERSSCSSADIAFVKWWLPWSDRSNGLIGPVWNEEEEDDEGVGEVECRREEGRRNQTLWFISICQIIHSSNIEQRKRCEALTPEWGKADKPFAVFNASFCSSIFIMRDSFRCTHQRNPLHIKYVPWNWACVELMLQTLTELVKATMFSYCSVTTNIPDMYTKRSASLAFSRGVIWEDYFRTFQPEEKKWL